MTYENPNYSIISFLKIQWVKGVFRECIATEKFTTEGLELKFSSL